MFKITAGTPLGAPRKCPINKIWSIDCIARLRKSKGGWRSNLAEEVEGSERGGRRRGEGEVSRHRWTPPVPEEAL